MHRLPEPADRLVALCEDDWVDLATARSVLESWFEKSMNLSELQDLTNGLIAEGYLYCRRGDNKLTKLLLLNVNELDAIEVKTTSSGDRYLWTTPGTPAE